MIAVVDYDVGNLFSLCSSLEAIGQKPVVTGDPQVIRNARRVILPGVGAFSDAVKKLRSTGLDDVLKEVAARKIPLMGICLGMQLLFEESLEFGREQGLGLIPGTVRPIAQAVSPQLKIPHIGWNALQLPEQTHPLLQTVNPGDCVYFVHSYYAADCAPHVIAWTEYEANLTAAVAKENVMGCQFHPEKSGAVGLGILKSFCREGIL